MHTIIMLFSSRVMVRVRMRFSVFRYREDAPMKIHVLCCLRTAFAVSRVEQSFNIYK